MKLADLKEGESLSAVRGHKIVDWTTVNLRGVDRDCPVVHVDGVPLVLHPDQLTHTVDGLEVPDQLEMDVPLEAERPVPLHVQMQQMIRNEISRAAAAAGVETFEEANDFDVEDDDLPPVTDHELAATEFYDEDLNPPEPTPAVPAPQPPAAPQPQPAENTPPTTK